MPISTQLSAVSNQRSAISGQQSAVSNQQLENDCRKWYVMSAFRQEKKAECALQERGVLCYVPKRYVIKTLNGRKLRTLQPAIANLIFVYASWNEMIELKQTLDYLQFQTQVIQKKRHVIVVPDDEMEQFIRVTELAQEDICYYRPEELDTAKGQLVRVIGGNFNGVEGKLMKITGKRQKRVVLQLEGVLAVAITIENPEYLEVIKS